jgi:hypothetical protein
MPSDSEDSSPRSRHLPWLLLLFVGSGCAGVTAGAFVVHPDIERIVICEI